MQSWEPDATLQKWPHPKSVAQNKPVLWLPVSDVKSRKWEDREIVDSLRAGLNFSRSSDYTEEVVKAT